MTSKGVSAVESEVWKSNSSEWGVPSDPADIDPWQQPDKLRRLPGVNFSHFQPSHHSGVERRLSQKAKVRLENPMGGGTWKAAVYGAAKSQTRLSNFTFTFHFHALEKEMATQSSILAWRIPGTGEPDGLPSMGSHRVGHD